MAIVCPNCGDKFKEWKEYALHILEEHGDDDDRCIWARDALNSENEMVVDDSKGNGKGKYKGKAIERVPVARRDSLPTHVRTRLEKKDKEYSSEVQDEVQATEDAPVKKAKRRSSKRAE